MSLLGIFLNRKGQESAPEQLDSDTVQLEASQLLPTVNLGRRGGSPMQSAAPTQPEAASPVLALPQEPLASLASAIDQDDDIRATDTSQGIGETTPSERPATLSTLNGGRSITGSRTKNEDSYLIDADRRLWAVSDGIGGAPFGEVISRVSCNYLPKAWDAATPSNPLVADRLLASIRLVDTYASELSDLLGRQGSGATFTVAHFDGGEVTIASVGDSRSYLLREGTLSQISNDGRLSQLSNALDQALGYHMALRPTIATFTPQVGDVLVICSDGVWSTQSAYRMTDSLVGDITTSAQMAAEGNPQQMAYRLTEGADMSDNATAVVVLFTQEEEPTLSTPSL